MADAFQFDAPHYADLTIPDSYESNYNTSYVSRPGVSDLSLQTKNSYATMNEPPNDGMPNVMEVDDNDCELSVRQSPRLASLAKGLLSKKQVKPARGSNHRRSLSEGAIIHSNLMKVKKISVSKGSSRNMLNINFNRDDLENLEQTTSIFKQFKPTKPKEFHFATDNRIKNNNTRKEDCIKDFVRTLRSDMGTNNSTSSKEISRGPTKIKAFKLHESRKAKEESKPFVSMAELNLKFESKTPLRFHTKRCTSAGSGNEGKKKTCNEIGVTIPNTPRLSTRLRSRPAPQYPTIEEIEEMELEEAQKNKFKAQPLNKKIFEMPKLELKDKKKAVTVPQPFDITDSKKQTNVGKQLFAACRAMGDSTWSLASIPHSGIAANWEIKSTQLKPFSFDSRDIDMLAKKKKKIEKLIEEEKKFAEFHAQTMPTFEGVSKGLPLKKVPTPTKVKPFNLRSDTRGLSKQEKLQQQLNEIIKKEEEARKFYAQSDAVVHKQPFIPEKSKKPLTDISGFSLNTEKRAEERLSFDIHLKEKGDEIVAKKIENEMRRKAEEEAEVSRIRKEVIHKAKPVPNYKPFLIKTGLLPATHPISPEFQTDRRLRARTSSTLNLNASAAVNSTFDMNR